MKVYVCTACSRHLPATQDACACGSKSCLPDERDLLSILMESEANLLAEIARLRQEMSDLRRDAEAYRIYRKMNDIQANIIPPRYRY